jgi:hypothetical protein
MEKNLSAAKKSLRNFKEVGKDLKQAGQTLSMAISLPLLGVVAAALAAAAEADAGVKASLESMKNEVTSTFAEIGKAILPSLVVFFEAVKPLLDIIKLLAEAFAGLPMPLQVIIVGMVGLAIAIGPVLMGLGSIMTAIAALAPVIVAVGGVLGVAFGSPILVPILAAVAAVVALVAAFIVLKEVVEAVFDMLGNLPEINLPNLGGFNIGNISLPHFAEGGVATRPMIASVAENEPEAIIPLSKLGGMNTGGETPNNSRNVSVHVYLDSREVTNLIGNKLVKQIGRDTGVRY